MQVSDKAIDEMIADLNSARRVPPPPSLPTGAGGGKPGPMAEDALKPRVDFLHTAFLWLAGILVTVVLGLVVWGTSLSTATNSRLDKSVEGQAALSREVGVVGQKVDEGNRRLDRLEDKIDKIAEKLGA